MFPPTGDGSNLGGGSPSGMVILTGLITLAAGAVLLALGGSRRRQEQAITIERDRREDA